MPSIKTVSEKVQLEIERFDGGRNTKDSPSRIGIFETPDALNVVYDDQGSVATRNGSSDFNTSTAEIGSFAIDGLGSYNGTMVAWAGGTMYRASGTTFVTVSSSQGQFSTGSKVAWAIHQNILFCSEGTSGPWRYEGGDNFYRMGITVASAPSASGTSAGNVAAGTYYYRISFVNSHVVEGEAGTANSETHGASAIVGLTNIPVGASSQGVASRKIYRASTAAGPYRYIDTIANNVTTTYADNTGPTTWAVGSEPPDDATAPTPFTTIRLHKERLFFDDSSNRTLGRWTEYETPFISKAESFYPFGKGDYSYITAIGVQNDLVCWFKQNEYWLTDLQFPDDDNFWSHAKGAAAIGIVGPRAFYEGDGFILFAGRQSAYQGIGKISGFYILQGFDLAEVATPILKTKNIASKIEPDILGIPQTLWSSMAIAGFNNKIYITTGNSSSTRNDHIWWFDVNRIADEDIGSWALWNGLNCNVLLVHDQKLYAGSSIANGKIYQLEVASQYHDSGAAINSYHWTKEYGGEDSIESWVKDFRWLKLWYELLGAWMMNVRYRADGDSGSGDLIQIDLTPGGSLWGTMTWGVDTWGGGRVDRESDHSLGTKLGRRIQIRFDNGNTVGRAFKVHRLKILMNLRSERR